MGIEWGGTVFLAVHLRRGFRPSVMKSWTIARASRRLLRADRLFLAGAPACGIRSASDRPTRHRMFGRSLPGITLSHRLEGSVVVARPQSAQSDWQPMTPKWMQMTARARRCSPKFFQTLQSSVATSSRRTIRRYSRWWNRPPLIRKSRQIARTEPAASKGGGTSLLNRGKSRFRRV